jgi:hypothetical protein
MNTEGEIKIKKNALGIINKPELGSTASLEIWHLQFMVPLNARILGIMYIFVCYVFDEHYR